MDWVWYCMTLSFAETIIVRFKLNVDLNSNIQFYMEILIKIELIQFHISNCILEFRSMFSLKIKFQFCGFSKRWNRLHSHRFMRLSVEGKGLGEYRATVALRPWCTVIKDREGEFFAVECTLQTASLLFYSDYWKGELTEIDTSLTLFRRLARLPARPLDRLPVCYLFVCWSRA